MKFWKTFTMGVWVGALLIFVGSFAQTQESVPTQERRPPIMPLPPGAPPPKAVPLGPYQVTVETDPSLPTHTVYRPSDLSPFKGGKLPIVAWGNGGCIAMGRAFESFLIKIASHGFLIVAIGPEDAVPPDFSAPKPGEPRPQLPPSMRSNSSQLLDGIDWALSQNDLSDSPYNGKLNPDAVAVMGQSCGGMQAIAVSGNPRVKTSVIWNSGVFSGPMPGGRGEAIGGPMSETTKENLKDFHAPVAYFIGGPTDIAYRNAEDDFTRIEGVPLFYANLNVGHGGTFHRDPNGGWFGEVGAAWLLWRLKGDEQAGKMFDGPECGLCVEPAWTIKKKNMD